jgi:hypothetical protein
VACRAKTVTFEVAGVHANSTYNMFSQTQTGGSVVNGQTISFNTGPLPGDHSFPAFAVEVAPGQHTDQSDK